MENNDEYRTCYRNQATSLTQALIIFLLDSSGSMAADMGSSNRIQVVKESLRATEKAMVQLSLKNLEVRPKYRVAMFGYSDNVFDITQGIVTIEQMAKLGVPNLQPLHATESKKAFKAALDLLRNEIPKLPHDAPAPLVIHMTDGRFTGEDPEPIVNEIKSLSTPDGHVLVENIYIAGDLKVSSKNPMEWPGYLEGDNVGNEYGNRLLKLSSIMPEAYRRRMTDMKYQIRERSRLMFPGILPEFVQLGFVMSTLTGVKGELFE